MEKFIQWIAMWWTTLSFYSSKYVYVFSYLVKINQKSNIFNCLEQIPCSFLPSIMVLYEDFVIEGGSTPESLVSDIMQALLINLELKSKQYKDPALGHIFLMNNYHYIVLSVRK